MNNDTFPNTRLWRVTARIGGVSTTIDPIIADTEHEACNQFLRVARSFGVTFSIEPDDYEVSESDRDWESLI